MKHGNQILSLLVLAAGLTACDGTLKDIGDSQGNDAAIQCLSPMKVLLAGEQAKLEWTFVNMAATELSFGPDLEANPSLYFTDTGTLEDGSTATEANYTAPATVSSILPLGIQAVAPDETAGSCRVLLSTGIDNSYAFGAADTGPFENPVATAYPLSTTPTDIPDFNTLSPSAVFPMKRFNKANNALAFAAIDSLVQLFALRISGKLIVTKTGTHTFRLTADDKASFWLNGQKLISDASASATGATSLAPGEYSILIEYFQGTGNSRLALEWQEPGSGFVVIPPASLKY